MQGPGVVWYVGIAAFLFGIGALGVLVRRNPLIVLLSLEIMLNGANLALIAFSRHVANGAGQIFALAVIGIPAAHGLHGYVGFMYGSLKSREWWSSDLMPVIFLFSAIISGVSLLAVLYVVSCKLRKIPIDLACLKGLAYTIWAFIMVALVLEGLEFANIVYKGREGVDMIMHYVTGPLLIPYFILQFAVGAITPFFWLSYMIWRGTTGKALVVGVTVCALLVLFSVFMMRWNVVIGGQEISKTGKGLLSYSMPLGGKEGALVAIALMLAPLALLFGLTRLFPPWEDEAQLTEAEAIGH